MAGFHGHIVLTILYQLAVLLTIVLAIPDNVERLGGRFDSGTGRPLAQPNITYLLEDFSLNDGVLLAISAFFLTLDPVNVQVWRPVSILDRGYNKVWDVDISINVPGHHTVFFSDVKGTDCALVHQGDRVGLHSSSAIMPIAYTFLPDGPPATLRHPLGASHSPVRRGDSVKFDALRYPYRFSINAFIHTDLHAYSYSGESTVQCPNISFTDFGFKKEMPITGKPSHPGNNGVVGHTGPQGPPGQQGPPGYSYPAPITYGDCDCKSFGDDSLIHSHIILVIFIWITTLTVANIFTIGVLCYRSLRKATISNSGNSPQNENNIWVEKIRETVREFGANNSSNNVTVALPHIDEKMAQLNY